MSTNADHLNELLTGLLDGVLTDDEQKTLDLAMKADPSLESKLAEMQALRRSLLRGRSVGRLSPDFSKHIVSAARKRAEEMGEDAPEWLRSSTAPSATRGSRHGNSSRESRTEQPLDVGFESGSVTIARSMSQRAWKVWVPMLAAATAASMVLYFAGPFSSQPTIQPLVGERVPDRSLRPDADSTGLELDDRETNKMAVDLLAKGSSKDSLDTTTESPKSKPNEADTRRSDVADAKPSVSNMSEPKLADATSSDRRASETKEMDSLTGVASELASNTVASDKSADPIRDLLDSKGVKNPIYTMVVDIAVDPVAEQNDALRSLLEEHEIVYADDLNISSGELDALVSSQMVGMMSGVDVARNSGDVQVLFVRAKARKIDSFLMEVVGQYKDFPRFRMDMSFDPSVVQLMNQLSTIANKQEGARRLTFRGTGDLGLVSAFPAANNKGEFLDIEKRKRLAGQPVGPKPQSKDETSYLILLVRSASSDIEKK